METFLRLRLRPHATYIKSGFYMYLDPLEWMQITLLSGQTTEPQTMRLFERLLKPGDVYLDVGAHVGFHTLVGAEGRVIAIEPQPYNCDRILRNWHLNGYENLFLYVAVAGRDHHSSGSTTRLPPTVRDCLSLSMRRTTCRRYFAYPCYDWIPISRHLKTCRAVEDRCRRIRGRSVGRFGSGERADKKYRDRSSHTRRSRNDEV